jgi:hypothetical protein
MPATYGYAVTPATPEQDETEEAWRRDFARLRALAPTAREIEVITPGGVERRGRVLLRGASEEDVTRVHNSLAVRMAPYDVEARP